VIVGVTQAATFSVQRISGGSQQILGAFAQDIFTPVPRLVVRSARASIAGTTTTATSRDHGGDGLPTANNKLHCPTEATRWSARAPRPSTTSRIA